MFRRVLECVFHHTYITWSKLFNPLKIPLVFCSIMVVGTLGFALTMLITIQYGSRNFAQLARTSIITQSLVELKPYIPKLLSNPLMQIWKVTFREYQVSSVSQTLVWFVNFTSSAMHPERPNCGSRYQNIEKILAHTTIYLYINQSINQYIYIYIYIVGYKMWWLNCHHFKLFLSHMRSVCFRLCLLCIKLESIEYCQRGKQHHDAIQSSREWKRHAVLHVIHARTSNTKIFQGFRVSLWTCIYILMKTKQPVYLMMFWVFTSLHSSFLIAIDSTQKPISSTWRR